MRPPRRSSIVGRETARSSRRRVGTTGQLDLPVGLPRQRPEFVLQCDLIKHLQYRAVPGLLYWHTPNGGWRTVAEARDLRRAGVLAGIPDLFFLLHGQLYGLELKVPGRSSSDAQLYVQELLADQGAIIGVAVGLDDAIAQLERWRLIRRAA